MYLFCLLFRTVQIDGKILILNILKVIFYTIKANGIKHMLNAGFLLFKTILIYFEVFIILPMQSLDLQNNFLL